MDKELIKMCDCPEIQDRWIPKEWDYVYSEEEWHICDRVWCILPDRIADSGVYGLSPENFKEEKDRYTKLTWLPTQGQLQAMVEKNPCEKIQDFLDFSFQPDIEYSSFLGVSFGGKDYSVNRAVFDSYEKLWLAFVMNKLYNKTWDGETWE